MLHLMNGDPDVVTDLRKRGEAVENAADASNKVPPFSPVHHENADETCLLAARGMDAGRSLTTGATGPAAAIAVRHEVPASEVWPDAMPDWAAVFGGQHRLTISVGDVWTPGAGRALLQRLLEGRTATSASSRRPPAERAVGATGQSTREDQPEPSVRAMPLPLAVTGPQSGSADDSNNVDVQGRRSLPWPPAGALPSAAVNRGSSSGLPLLAIIARVSLAIAVREAATDGPLDCEAAPAPKSGPLQPTLRVPLVALDGAPQPRVDSPNARYGPSRLESAGPPRDEEPTVTLPEWEPDSGAYVNAGVGS